MQVLVKVMETNENFQVKINMKKTIGKIKDRILKITYFDGLSREGWRLIRPAMYEVTHEEVQEKMM